MPNHIKERCRWEAWLRTQGKGVWDDGTYNMNKSICGDEAAEDHIDNPLTDEEKAQALAWYEESHGEENMPG